MGEHFYMFAQQVEDVLDSWLVTKGNRYNSFDLIKSVKWWGYTNYLKHGCQGQEKHIICSGVTGAFPGGRLAHPEGQNEEENK